MPESEILQAIILGVVQGITEFLPISSSGHLVVFQKLFERWFGQAAGNEQQRHLMMDVVLHVGTLFSIIVIYRRELWALRRQPRLCLLIVLATIPAAIAGIKLKPLLEQAFESPLVVACGWFVTAGFLWCGQKYQRDERPLEGMLVRDAIVVGLFQAVALVPGISRAGSTIAGGLLSGMQRNAAASFSFLIAIPVIAGAAVLEVAKPLMSMIRTGQSFDAMWQIHGAGQSPWALLAGAVTSFLVGLVALRSLLKLISQRRLHWFAIYCLCAAVATLIWQGAEMLQP